MLRILASVPELAMREPVRICRFSVGLGTLALGLHELEPLGCGPTSGLLVLLQTQSLLREPALEVCLKSRSPAGIEPFQTIGAVGGSASRR